jgi:hypothetical protein
MRRLTIASRSVEGMAADSRSGGAHTSRTIMVKDLARLLSACSLEASQAEYANAVLVENVLAKQSYTTRHRTLRYLRELYGLDAGSITFRALRDLWGADPESLPLLAMQSALTRDQVLRATSRPIFSAQVGAAVDSRMLADAVSATYPGTYRDSVLAKIGRNTASSWTQSGHLTGRSRKIRSRAQSSPATVAYGLMLGYLADARGEGLVATVWGQTLDSPIHEIYEKAAVANKRGWMEFRRAGDVIDVGFRWLLRSPTA